MKSGIVPFEEIVLSVIDETGIQNLVPYYEKIRRFIFRAEREIGYGGAIIRRKLKYSVSNGTFNGLSIKLPTDYISLEGVNFDGSDLFLTDIDFFGNPQYIHLKNRTDQKDLYLTYYGMVCDGFGNPLTTRNHEEAIVAYIVWKLYKPRVFLNKGNASANLEQFYEARYNDYLLASRGHDAFPSNWQEIEQIGDLLKMSNADIIKYVPSYTDNNNYDTPNINCVLEGININVSGIKVYHWQYNSPSIQVTEIVNVNQEFLDEQTFSDLSIYEVGSIISYSLIGRIGFAIQPSTLEQYRIFDILDHDITETVFERYYNSSIQTTVYVSKEHYSHSNLLFKIKPI